MSEFLTGFNLGLAVNFLARHRSLWFGLGVASTVFFFWLVGRL